MKDMETRKVQMTGGSSYVISLPKDWIRRQKIEKNDPLGVHIQPDGALLITTSITERPLRKVKEFTVQPDDDPVYLFRCLIGAYIVGHSTIHINSSRKIPQFVRQVVRNFTQMTIGQEVEKETDSSITIRDILNPTEMTFENSIRRMYIIVKNMHEDVIGALVSGNKVLAEDVIARDNDVDRLNWLIARQFHLILEDATIARKMNTPVGVAADYFQISKIIERIGDHAVNIAKNAICLLDTDINPALIKQIRSASNTSLALFDESIQALWRDDLKKTNAIIDAVKTLSQECEEITAAGIHIKGGPAICLGYIAESIGRTGEYAGDISETIINHLIGNKK